MNKNNNQATFKIWQSIINLAKRKVQDIERGLDEPGWLFPPTRHTITKDDLRGDPNKIGKISLAPYVPQTSSSQIEIANFFLKNFTKLILGKNLPQKRVRPNHERDKTLIKDKKAMDKLIFKEIEQIEDNKEFSQADRKARKRLTQAQYRYSKKP